MVFTISTAPCSIKTGAERTHTKPWGHPSAPALECKRSSRISQMAPKARRSRGRASPRQDKRDECVPHTGALAVRLGSEEDRRQQAHAGRQTHRLDEGPQELPAERGTQIPRRNVLTSHTHRAQSNTSSSGRPAVQDTSLQDVRVDTTESWQNPLDERSSRTPTRSPRAKALVHTQQKQ